MDILNIMEITSNNGYVVTDYAGNNSITFFAEMPKNAAIKTIEIDGLFIEDIGRNKNIEFPRRLTDGSKKEIATIFFNGEIPKELFNKINNYVIQSFNVYYKEEAFTVIS